MDTNFNQQHIKDKTNILSKYFQLFLESTIIGAKYHIMTEYVNFIQLIQTEYHTLIFESELFKLLLKNKFAISKSTTLSSTANVFEEENNNGNIVYANVEYPFSLIICSSESFTESILVNNTGIVVIKFILYLRMLKQMVANASCPNCFLATNLEVLPFGRICIDIDYKNDLFGNANDELTNEDYEKFIEKCFTIVCNTTTTGNLIMTKSCYTPNTRSFHLITEQQFDIYSKKIIFKNIAENIFHMIDTDFPRLKHHIQIDDVKVWMLPFGRGHVPTKKFNRKKNEFENLSFPYSEIDFELCMPFDLNMSIMGIDNMYTLFTYNNIENAEDSTNILIEYENRDEIIARYYLNSVNDLYNNLQQFVKIISSKYEYAFSKQINYRYGSNYIYSVLCNRYNNFFLSMSNKKLLIENNWQIPKQKINQRPTEFYEIYRFINYKFTNGITTMEDLCKEIPTHLVSRNVNIGNLKNDNETINESSFGKKNGNDDDDINDDYNGDMEFEISDAHNNFNVNNYDLDICQTDDIHPWEYINSRENAELFPIATQSIRNIYEFFHNTIPHNVYDFEKMGDRVMKAFRNVQTFMCKGSDDAFASDINVTCKKLLNSCDNQKIQMYIYPMYEFFCRVHYIDACISKDELCHLDYGIHIFDNNTIINNFRKKYIEMSPGTKAFEKFPAPGTALHNIWYKLTPKTKIVLHILYLMIVENNYTSIFIHLHKILDKKNKTQSIVSFMLNIIDCSYEVNNRKIYAYKSKEFLNFIYRTLFDAGPNIKCEIVNKNIQFNLTNIEPIITDMQKMFIGSPIWYFLSHFQYMDENMEYLNRFDIFTQIFRQPPTMVENNQNNQNNYQNGNNRRQRSNDGPTPAKQAKKTNFNPEPYFKMYFIQEMNQVDLLIIFIKNILCFCESGNGNYIYDGSRYIPSTLVTSIKAITTTDPVKFAHLYRHQYGIYNSWTMQFERNISVLYTHITIGNDDFANMPHLFNAYNDDIYRLLINRYLKSILFTRVLNYQKNLGLLLAPIYDPNCETITNMQTLSYNIDSIQINIHDLASSDYVLPEKMFDDLLSKNTDLYIMFKWLYCIICHYSDNFACKITTPHTFIPSIMLPVSNKTKEETDDSIFNDDIDYSAMDDDDSNNGENLIQRIHKILNSKKSEQQKNITDELQKLSQQELTSLIILFDNISNNEENTKTLNDECMGDGEQSSDSHTSKQNSSSPVIMEEIKKYNLSTRGTGSNISELEMLNREEYIDNAKIKLLINLFNRKLCSEIKQMTIDDFQHVITENFNIHISRFVLLILSWFIRTIHTHVFSDTIFFREIQNKRQDLYNELCELTIRHNGYFMYNNSIVDIVDIFGYFCKHTEIVVDPIFEQSFHVDSRNLYLTYDTNLESRVSREIIKDIEAGCISNIYQGQFIENTNVDLSRLWARVTIPRNKHRISPLFTMHTATGKSEYLAEKCSKQFNNKYYNNFLDSTSLRTNERGIDIAPEMHTNLIVCIEEFTNLDERFKQLCGHTALTYKQLYNNSKSSFQNNATIILSTNNDPTCTEEAVIARLHVYPRRIQYSILSNHMKFQRTRMCSMSTTLKINNIMTVQMIMEKMPRVFAENYSGNFMMTWILKRFFLYNILDPVTIQVSETLQTHMDNFSNMINAAELVLDRLELDTGSMALFKFRRLVHSICEENRNLFLKKVDTYNVYTKLCDKLKTLIDNESQTIRVSEKAIK